MDKKAFYKLTYGLFLLTTREGEKDNGCIINTAVQVANDPARISIAVLKGNHTHDMVLRTGSFTVSSISTAACGHHCRAYFHCFINFSAAVEQSVKE